MFRGRLKGDPPVPVATAAGRNFRSGVVGFGSSFMAFLFGLRLFSCVVRDVAPSSVARGMESRVLEGRSSNNPACARNEVSVRNHVALGFNTTGNTISRDAIYLQLPRSSHVISWPTWSRENGLDTSAGVASA